MQIDQELQFILTNFESQGTVFIDGGRNVIKLFDYKNKTVNIKSFKIPNFINKVIYKYFRKSKAKRSFEFAKKLTNLNIGTPEPIAYYEEKSFFGLKKSFFISEHLKVDLLFRDLVEFENYPDNELILKQFTHFCYQLHKNGVEFLDHSPGNTLIKKVNSNEYSFYLVDLNRMKFHETMKFQKRMKNLSRLTPKENMIRAMSSEYAKLSGEDENLIFETIWKETIKFQHQYFRKKRLKKKFGL